MAKHLTRGSTVNKLNPVLDTYVAVEGILIAPQSLTFAIYDISTPQNEATPVTVVSSTTVDLVAALVSPGRYAATWTVPIDAALGRYVIQWTAQLVAGGPTVSWAYTFDVVAMFMIPVGDAYANVSDVRAEGVPSSISDARILEQLVLASQQLTIWTGRSFVPKYKSVTVDGQTRETLWLDEPICAIEQVRLVGVDGYIDAGSYMVYNRHLTQNLLSPDDRDFPQIARRGLDCVDYYTRAAWASAPWLMGSRLSWGFGRQSVRVDGVFGYTDWDGSPIGCTPMLAKLVTVLIAMKSVSPAYKSGTVGGVWSSSGPVTSMRTREQTITFGNTSYGSGGSTYDNMSRYTGDPIIDAKIELLCKPLVGAVV